MVSDLNFSMMTFVKSADLSALQVEKKKNDDVTPLIFFFPFFWQAANSSSKSNFPIVHQNGLLHNFSGKEYNTIIEKQTKL